MQLSLEELIEKLTEMCVDVSYDCTQDGYTPEQKAVMMHQLQLLLIAKGNLIMVELQGGEIFKSSIKRYKNLK